MDRISKVPQEYGGRQIKIGERFHVEPQHVGLLLTLGRIEPMEGEIGYVSRDMTAAESASYRTREMQRKKAGRR